MYTVLAITTHPDDMEINCAGTLLKCKARGDRVVVCHLCNGDLGHEIIQPHELAEIRAGEAQRSGAGCSPHFTEEGLRLCEGTLTCSKSRC